MSNLEWRFLGEVPYVQAWDWQRELRQLRIAKTIENQLVLLEHPATITLGRLRGEKSLLHSNTALEEQGVTVVRSDRGGDATLHAPGQMVGYLIVDLTALGLALPVFVERIAGAFIDYLKTLGIKAHYDTKYPGVWVGTNKVVAFGFHIQKGVTMHGFAFNIQTELELFDLIIPCGLQQRGATSVQALLRDTQRPIPNMQEAAQAIAEGIACRLDLQERHTPELPLS